MTQSPPQYVVRDTAGNIYGPATAAMLRQWIVEGRLTAAMSVAEQGSTQFVVAGTIPQLRETFAQVSGAGSTHGAGATGGLAGVGAGGGAGGLSGPTGGLGAPHGVGGVPANTHGPAYQTPSYGVPNHPLAVTSLILGLVGIPALAFCPLSFVAELLAIIFGHIARSQIRREPERYGGQGMATAGLIIGYCMLALIVLGVLAYILFIVLVVGGAAAGAGHPAHPPGRPF